MVKQPWMKIFVGDWIRDTRRLTMRARGAYADLKMNLWISDITGVITGDITDVSLMLGVSVDETAQLLEELRVKKVFKIELCNNNSNNRCYNITDEEMVSKVAESAAKSAAGTKAMKNRWKKNEINNSSSVITSVITNDITGDKGDVITYNNSDINTGIDIGSEIEKKGGAGGKHSFAVLPNSTLLPIEDCLDLYLTDAMCTESRNLLIVARAIKPEEADKVLPAWLKAFNNMLLVRMEKTKTVADYCQHFFNWMRINYDKNKDPKNIANGAGSKKTTANTGSDRGVTGTGILQPGDSFWGNKSLG